MSSPIAIFFGPPGMVELLVVAMIFLLLFGNRLPSVMRSMGRGIVEFKKGVKGIEDDVEEAGNRVENGAKKEEDGEAK